MKVYLQLDENNFIIGWGTSPDDNSIETDLDVNDKRLLECFSYQYIDGELIFNESKVLEEAKKVKLQELTSKCSQIILDGFYYPINGVHYKFGFSTSDQSNFTSTALAMNIGMINEIEWTVELKGEKTRITLDKKAFMKLCQASLEYKDEKIKYLRGRLQPLVEQAETLEDLNKIMWGV